MYFAIGTLMSLIMIFGIAENAAILYTYWTNKKLRTTDNVFIVGVALSDLGQSVLGIPFVVIASFSKRWIFGFGLCQYYAFITTFLGISQVAMLTVLAVERYNIIVRCQRKLSNSYKRCLATISFSFLYGMGWATGPLIGWSSYEEESKGIACSVSWELTDPKSFSYTVSLFTFGWFIPLIVISFGYLNIAWTIYRERVRKLTFKLTSQKTLNRDRKVALTVLFMIGAFIVSWLPYSAVSLWSAVGNFNDIPEWAQVAPAVFAKCSIIWNPIIYVARHSKFRKAVKESIFRCTDKTQNLFVGICRKPDRNKDISNIKNSVGCSEIYACNNNSYKDDTVNDVTNISVTFTGLSTYTKRQMFKKKPCSSGVSVDDIYELVPMVSLKEKESPPHQVLDTTEGRNSSQAVHKDETDKLYKHKIDKLFASPKISSKFALTVQQNCETSKNVDKSEEILHSLEDETNYSVAGANENIDCDLEHKDKYNIPINMEDIIYTQRSEGKADSKLNFLKKRRIKLRSELACLYSQIYHLQSLPHQDQTSDDYREMFKDNRCPLRCENIHLASTDKDTQTKISCYSNKPSKLSMDRDKVTQTYVFEDHSLLVSQHELMNTDIV